MFRGLIELFNILLWWCFLYVGSFMLMVVAIVYLIKTNPSPPTPIINEYHSSVQVIESPKRVLIEEGIYTRLDGCPIVNGICVDCLTVKN